MRKLAIGVGETVSVPVNSHFRGHRARGSDTSGWRRRGVVHAIASLLFFGVVVAAGGGIFTAVFDIARDTP